MLSELQIKKLTRLFNIFDTDGNGVLEKNDFEKIVANFLNLYNVKPGTLTYKDLSKKYLLRWERLQQISDKNQDKKVSLAEWLEYYEDVVNYDYGNEEPLWRKRANVSFDIIDTNKDGVWSLQEYQTLFKIYGLDEQLATEIFPRLDLNSDGHISKEEYLQLTEEFYLSDDPKSPGNFLFGLYE